MVRYHEAAEEELLSEIGYLELRARGLGQRFVDEVKRAESYIDEFPSVLAPGVVLATYRLARSDSADGVPEYFLRSSIWKLIGKRWQMVFHQGTTSRAP